MNNRNNLAMDEELLRMRDEISRVTIERERREMEAARAGADMIHYKEDLARITGMVRIGHHTHARARAFAVAAWVVGGWAVEHFLPFQ